MEGGCAYSGHALGGSAIPQMSTIAVQIVVITGPPGRYSLAASLPCV